MSHRSSEERDAIVARAARDAEAFLRQTWRERRRSCLFVGGGVFTITALVALLVSQSVESAVTLGLALSGALGAALWCAVRWRCPRCERAPIASGATSLAPGRCPHCGLKLKEEGLI